MNKSFHIIIPARFDSSRLPGKVLLDINGKPMLQHVYERAQQTGADSIVVATDNQQVADVASDFGADVCMTASDHPNGTARIAEVLMRRNFADDALIVNCQGDEPRVPPALLQQVADTLAASDAPMASLMTPIYDAREVFDPNIVKVVTDKQQKALYFSRAPIPWHREAMSIDNPELANGLHQRHLGLYAYRAGFVKAYVEFAPSPLEPFEKLEQLRVLWHGYAIQMATAVEVPPPGVDTEADLAALRAE